MTAKQLLYFGPRRARVTRARRNPRPRRRRVVATAAPRRASSSRRRTYYRYARRRGRTIARSAGSFIERDVVPAAIGAAGAFALDMLWPHLTFLPVQLQTGPMAPIVRLGGAALLGVAAGMFMGRRVGTMVTIGSMIPTMYDIGKGYLAANTPPPAPAQPAQVSGYAPRSLGWISPARDAGGRLHGYAPMSGYAPMHA